MHKSIWVRVLSIIASGLLIVSLAWLLLWIFKMHDGIAIANASNSLDKGNTPIAQSTSTRPSFLDTTSTFPQNPTNAQIAAYTTYVTEESIAYGVNPNLSICIVSHESQWVGDKIGDRDGKYGVSRGWVQINTYFHPDITEAEAFSLPWSINWMLTQVVNGHVGWWSTYHQFCSKVPVFLKTSAT